MDISTFRSIEISSWASFVSHIEELSQVKEVWYRGQPSNWPLRPHLLRHFLRGGITSTQTARAIEYQATKEFKRAAHLHLPIARLLQLATDEQAQEHRQGTGLVAWWTVMRHHGAPTRLLDWTLSPYVAAYFACEPVLETTNRPFGVVWVLDFGSLRAHMDAKYASDGATRILDHLMVAPEAPDDLLPLFNEMPTERMLAQQGCFTVCRNVLGDHGELIRAAVPSALTCLRIPDGIKAEFRWRLRQVNLTAYTLFGELDGLGRHTDEAVTILVDQHSRVSAV